MGVPMRFNQKAPVVLRPLLFFVLCLLGGGTLFAEISAPGSPPSQAVPQVVHVTRGGAVTIKLSVYGPPEPVTFLLRSKPALGKLTASTWEGRGDILIAYRHSGERFETQDRFTYAAKTSSGVSAAATVVIEIDDPPARLSATPRLDFGEVPVGETKELELDLENAGGAPASGSMESDNAWQIREGASYRINGGAKQKLHVIFSPDHVGPTEGAISYSSDHSFITELSGRGVESYFLDSGTLQLQAPNKNTPLSAKVAIHNRLRDNLTLHITVPSPLQADETLQIPPLGTGELVIKGPLPGAQIDDSITVSDGTFTAQLRVEAQSLPAALSVDKTTLDFGSVIVGKNGDAKVVITNSGGSTANIAASTQAPFSIDETDRKFTLAPGTNQSVLVTFTPEASGKIEGTLNFESDGKTIAVRCIAEAQPAPAIAAPKPTFDLAQETQSSAQPVLHSSLKPVSSLQATRVKPNSVTLEWPSAGDAAKRYEVQQLTLFRDAQKKLSLEWRTLSDLDILRDGDTF